MTGRLPHRYFISHSYKDIEIRNQLLSVLPPGVESIIFPPITVTPNQMVSNDLVKAILDCDSLIWLDGGQSQNSFWVAFERDYAIRAHKNVFRFDPTILAVEPDTTLPLRLPVFPNYTQADKTRVDTIIRILKQDRFFDLFIEEEDLQPGTAKVVGLEQGMTSRLVAGGYLVAFLSNRV